MSATTHPPGESVTALLNRTRSACGIAVIDESGIAWSRVTGGPPGMLFQAGSISKPVTALAALELAARGQADLDADVNEQLTSWQLPGPGPVSLRRAARAQRRHRCAVLPRLSAARPGTGAAPGPRRGSAVSDTSRPGRSRQAWRSSATPAAATRSSSS